MVTQLEFRDTENGFVVEGLEGYKFLDPKVMKWGETRLRFKGASGDKLVHTIAIPTPYVQDGAHSYKGLVARYVLLRGWIAMLHAAPGGAHMLPEIDILSTRGETFEVQPCTQHTVMTGPNAQFLTFIEGTPVPNPDKNGNDWWPADEKFTPWALSQTVDTVAAATGVPPWVLQTP